jgi:hypothetical protein
MTPRRHRWIRPAARVPVCALIGAAATVAVAWGLKVHAANNPGHGWTVVSFFGSAELQPWPVRVPAQWPLGRPDTVSRRLGVEYQEWDAIEYMQHSIWLEVLRVGFPAKALGAHYWHDIDNQHRSRARHSGVLGRHDKRGIGSLTSLWSGLPCNPLWPGFLVDTAFWGGAAFMVWSAPGFVRRGVRRRRGRCVRCGYELKGLAVCPECGGGA